MTEVQWRDKVVASARSWLGTPYQHQASVKHVGCDCLGLVRGVYRDVVGREPEAPPPYTPHWAEFSLYEPLWAAAKRHLREIDITAAVPGDVLLFRVRRKGPAKHLGILSGPVRMIHAYSGLAVTETALVPWWRRRIVSAFRFPVGEEPKR